MSQRRKEYEREKGRIEKPEMNAGVSVNSGEKMNDEGREIIIAMITKQLKGRRGRGGGGSTHAPFLLSFCSFPSVSQASQHAAHAKREQQAILIHSACFST